MRLWQADGEDGWKYRVTHAAMGQDLTLGAPFTFLPGKLANPEKDKWEIRSDAAHNDTEAERAECKEFALKINQEHYREHDGVWGKLSGVRARCLMLAKRGIRHDFEHDLSTEEVITHEDVDEMLSKAGYDPRNLPPDPDIPYRRKYDGPYMKTSERVDETHARMCRQNKELTGFNEMLPGRDRNEFGHPLCPYTRGHGVA